MQYLGYQLCWEKHSNSLFIFFNAFSLFILLRRLSFVFFCLLSYLRRLLLVRIRNMIRTLAPMPSPATRNMIPAACSAFSLHSIVVPLVAFLSCSPLKMPAPGMPLEIVLLREDIFFSFQPLAQFDFDLKRFLFSSVCLRPECGKNRGKIIIWME